MEAQVHNIPPGADSIIKVENIEENPMVARFTLINMTQDREETVRSFGARLSDQAGVCKFKIQCDCCDQDVNYTDDILRDVVIRGLDDPEIQAELVCDQKENMTLEQVFQFVEANEGQKRIASKILDTHQAKAVNSYRRHIKTSASNKPEKGDKHTLWKYKKGYGNHALVKHRKKYRSACAHLRIKYRNENHLQSVCGRKYSEIELKSEGDDFSDGEEIDNIIDEEALQSDSSIEAIDNMFYEQASQSDSSIEESNNVCQGEPYSPNAESYTMDDEAPDSPSADIDTIKIETDDNQMPGAEGLSSRTLKAKKITKGSKAEKKPCVCTVCDKSFSLPYRLNQHMIVHTGKNPKECDVCGEIFSRKRDLKSHKKAHAEEIPLVCNVCNRTFRWRSALIQHMSIHTGEKRHKCKECNKGFNVLSNLHRHMFTHTEERNVVCTVCGQTFKHEGILSDHMLVHTDVRKFVCKVCGKAFKKSDTLKRHMRTHTGDKPHMCNICGKTFGGSGSLTRHVNLHTGEKSHVCNFCGKAFNDKSNLKRHMKNHTGEKQSTSCE